MKKLLNSSLAIVALALVLLFSGKAAWAATTNGSTNVTGQTISVKNINSASPTTYTTTLTTGTEYFEAVPLSIPEAGVLRVDVTNVKTDVGVDVYLCTAQGYEVSCIYNAENGYDIDWEHFVVSKGTYYLCFETSSALTNVQQTVKFTAALYPSTATLTSGKTVKAGSASISNQYYKIVVKKNSLIKVLLKEEDSSGGSYVVNLCSSKKKAYNSNLDAIRAGDSAYFAVKKGTYYISVQAPKRSDGSPARLRYSLKATVKAYTDQAGSSKTKAKTIAKKKTVNGMVLATDKKTKTDYFKFTLTKSAKVSLNVSGNITAGALYFWLDSKAVSGKYTWNLTSSTNSRKISVTTTSSSKLPKGTYYIYVRPQVAGSNGTYSIKVNY